MTATIVKTSQLGTNCWAPMRFTGSCASCLRYDTCRYPERVPDKAYDNLRANAAKALALSKRLYTLANKRAGRSRAHDLER